MIERISIVYLLAEGEREIVARAARHAAESGDDPRGALFSADVLEMCAFTRENLRMFARWLRAFEGTERARGGVHADEAQETATRLASYANAKNG